jgi:Ca2+:H+ antiporter
MADTSSIKSLDSRPLLPKMPEEEKPHLFGVRPHTTLTRKPFVAPAISFDHLSYINFQNIFWTVLVGWWLSIFIALNGVLLIITGFGYKLGVRCLKLARFVLYPFGRYAYLDDSPPPNIVGRVLFYIFTSVFVFVPLVLAMVISWELMFYIPMAKFLSQVLTKLYTNIWRLKFERLVRHNVKSGHLPALLTYSSGSFIYMRYSIFSMEVPYINLWPFIIITFWIKFTTEEQKVENAVLFTFISIIATIPCMYVIGVCTEIISSRAGLVLGSLINAGFTGLVELILFTFSIAKGLGGVVSSALTGAFLMNLLVIPGLAMLAAGIKWKEVKINRKVQSVSGTFLFLAIVAVFFPAVFYNIYKRGDLVCNECNGVQGVFHVSPSDGLNCTLCSFMTPDILDNDDVYRTMAKPLMYTASILMPIVYAVGMFFSLHTHKYIYDQFENEQEGEGNHVTIKTYILVIILLVSCIIFSIVCEIITDVMPNAITAMNLTERFVGLVFYTLIPAVAEFMNAIRFALEGNLGLSLEIGNQGALVVSLIQMPALVLISLIFGKGTASTSFTLMFETIDIFAIIISVLLRNFMLMEKSINYFTGFAFMIIFLLIAVVYYFDPY